MFYIKSFTFSPIQENTYVLYNDSKECIIIDPGCYFDEEKDTIKNFIYQKQLVPKFLLNTHCHLDHVFGNKFIAEEYNLNLKTHPLEKGMLELAPTSGLMYNLPFDNYSGEIIPLVEGDVVKLGEDELKVIEAPGHSPGSICFYCEKQGFLIGGDVLFQNSIGRTDLPGGSHNQLINNIKEKLLILPKNVVVYSGHGPETTIGHEMENNPYLN